ncbi:nucleoside triphosphate pyrophosphohydrolase family protein [Rhodococcus baikonurensis]|uniref:MazG nucleotide pyrophosphohydrolase domain-containing protein n=1 Tax=Rhodococcus baikonurensis TaxID=172041 RepID=A0ABV5XNE1_9NOCA
MNIDEYQRQAWKFDQHHDRPETGITIALLGLGGEVGTLQTNQKKRVRDGDVHSDHRAALVEDLGDILWYVADAATWLGVDLGEVAQSNLDKISNRWARHDAPFPDDSAPRPIAPAPQRTTRPAPPLPAAHLFDGRFGTTERLPRRIEVHIAGLADGSGTVRPVVDGTPIGNEVGDNSYDPDGYRWHDAFHLANLAVLGWSPVMRALLKRKRRSDPSVDSVEDGGRAIAVEEGISALIFDTAGRTGMHKHAKIVDSELLKTCQRMVAPFEVRACTALEWEHAIIQGCQVWSALQDNGNGVVTCDLDARNVTVRPMSPAELVAHAEACMPEPAPL